MQTVIFREGKPIEPRSQPLTIVIVIVIVDPNHSLTILRSWMELGLPQWNHLPPVSHTKGECVRIEVNEILKDHLYYKGCKKCSVMRNFLKLQVVLSGESRCCWQWCWRAACFYGECNYFQFQCKMKLAEP